MRTLFLAALAVASLVWSGAQNYTTNYIDDDFDWAWAAVFGRTELSATERYRIERARYRVWLDLCFEYRKVSCADIPVPKVSAFRPNPVRPGLLGFYDGGNTVFIRDNLYGYDMEEVLAHEMSHYWDAYTGLTIVPGPAKQICFSEKRAWAVSDAFWIDKGFSPEDQRIVGSKWVLWYAHCTPYADELYPA